MQQSMRVLYEDHMHEDIRSKIYELGGHHTSIV